LYIDLLIVLGIAIAIGIPLWAIIDAARRNDRSFQQIGSDKTRWIVILVVLSEFSTSLESLPALCTSPRRGSDYEEPARRLFGMSMAPCLNHTSVNKPPWK
jgi:hypothetical protein